MFPSGVPVERGRVLASRYREARVALGEAEYSKILRELRFSQKAKLNPEQAVRVFNFMTETMYGKRCPGSGIMQLFEGRRS